MAPSLNILSGRQLPQEFTAPLADESSCLRSSDSTGNGGAHSRRTKAKAGSGMMYAWHSDALNEVSACTEKTEAPHVLSGNSEEEVSQFPRGQASPLRSPLRKRPQQLLDAVLKRIIPCDRAVPSAPPSPVKLSAAPKKLAADDEFQLAAFRKFLAKSHGNITRAFRVMKTNSARAVGTGSRSEKQKNSNQLSAAEFEWCIIAQLKYGDRRLARQLFKCLDRDRKGAIGLCELAKEGSQSACSLVEFRRLLLDRYPSLATAFRELEEYLVAKHPDRAVKNRCMTLAEFIEASAFFGMGAQQAVHMFQVLDIDGNGDLTMQEFMESLTNVPRQVLLQDFRQRLLSRYSSVQCAFKVMKSAGDNVRMRCPEFVSALVAIGVADLEAAELFRLIDTDGSGDVSFFELLNALRECAPNVDLDTFWQRFAREWPEFSIASARRSSGLVEARREFACLVTALTCGDVPKRPKSTLSYDEFDNAIAARLDISQENSLELFQRILTSTWCQGQERIFEGTSMTLPHEAAPGGLSISQGDSLASSDRCEIYLDDFLDQLHLWTVEPTEAVSASTVKKGVLDGMVRPLKAAKAAIRSLKKDLQSFGPKDAEASAAGGLTDTGHPKRKKMVKPPWSTRSAPMTFNQVVLLT